MRSESANFIFDADPVFLYRNFVRSLFPEKSSEFSRGGVGLCHRGLHRYFGDLPHPQVPSLDRGHRISQHGLVYPSVYLAYRSVGFRRHPERKSL